ncbi:hypothetical protein KKF84_16235, partial [Myxococcota bacterium]|nr:hypothetical protein [Myxococcota bacterium]MBU1536874.1 hypothetical protein [Myxococcota bacterium]
PENCSNGSDDDGDGRIDCFDTDCYLQPKCGRVPATEHWINNYDGSLFLIADDVAVDADGSIYVCMSAFQFGGGDTSEDTVLLKLDGEGELLWQASFTEPGANWYCSLGLTGDSRLFSAQTKNSDGEGVTLYEVDPETGNTLEQRTTLVGDSSISKIIFEGDSLYFVGTVFRQGTHSYLARFRLAGGDAELVWYDEQETQQAIRDLTSIPGGAIFTFTDGYVPDTLLPDRQEKAIWGRRHDAQLNLINEFAIDGPQSDFVEAAEALPDGSVYVVAYYSGEEVGSFGAYVVMKISPSTNIEWVTPFPVDTAYIRHIPLMVHHQGHLYVTYTTMREDFKSFEDTEVRVDKYELQGNLLGSATLASAPSKGWDFIKSFTIDEQGTWYLLGEGYGDFSGSDIDKKHPWLIKMANPLP